MGSIGWLMLLRQSVNACWWPTIKPTAWESGSLLDRHSLGVVHNISTIMTYQLSCHTNYHDIPIIMTYQLSCHTNYHDISIIMPYQLSCHTNYHDKSIIMPYQLSWHINYHDIIIMTYQCYDEILVMMKY